MAGRRGSGKGPVTSPLLEVSDGDRILMESEKFYGA